MVDTSNAEVEPPLGWKHLIAALPTILLSKAPKSRMEVSKHINSYVREGRIPRPQKMYDALDDKYKHEVNVSTFKTWHVIFQLKHLLLNEISVTDGVKCYIDNELSDHEGFVTISDSPYKIVDRLIFSRANFNLNKNWKHEKV